MTHKRMIIEENDTACPDLFRIGVNLTCPVRDKILVERNLAPHKSAVGTKYNFDFKDNISSLKGFKL